MSEKLYKVKEFAELAGITVRTLQYYDKTDLLKPSLYTEAKHRHYRREDLLRLQQILTLKYIGFSLEEIRWLLNSSNYDVKTSLEIQREALDERVTQLQRASRALKQTLNLLSSAKPKDLDWSLVTEIIRSVAEAEKWQWVHRYYTPKQQKVLVERAKSYTPQQMLRDQQRWEKLMAAFQRLQKQGRKPSDPQAQKLAAQMEALIHEFTQGDEGIRHSLNRAYSDLDKLPKEQKPIDLELQRYMSEACRIYNQNQKKKRKVSKR